MLGIGRILRTAFGYRSSFPLMEVPKAMVWLVAPLAGLTREFVAKNVGYRLAFDNTRTLVDLGVSFRPAEESVVEHFQQMIDDGIVKG